MRLPVHGKYMVHLTQIPDLSGSRIQTLENVALRQKFITNLQITSSTSLHSKHQTAHLFFKDLEVTLIYLRFPWSKSLNMDSSSREHSTQDVSTCLKYIWAKRGTAMFIKLCAVQHSLKCLYGWYYPWVLPCQAPFMIIALSELKEAACDH